MGPATFWRRPTLVSNVFLAIQAHVLSYIDILIQTILYRRSPLAIYCEEGLRTANVSRWMTVGKDPDVIVSIVGDAMYDLQNLSLTRPRLENKDGNESGSDTRHSRPIPTPVKD